MDVSYFGECNPARIFAKPSPHIRIRESTGIHYLNLREQRDTLIYVPKSYSEQSPSPVVVLLHGAGGEGKGMFPILEEQAEKRNLILVAPTSIKNTWDFLTNRYGPDVRMIDRALQQVFSRYSVDPRRVAIAGFSDGASYALSLGTANGDLFTHIMAFSPGFMSPPAEKGVPHVFISHGKEDSILPIDRCSRKIASVLAKKRYPVWYTEFEGAHSVPPSIVMEAIHWFMKGEEHSHSLQ